MKDKTKFKDRNTDELRCCRVPKRVLVLMVLSGLNFLNTDLLLQSRGLFDFAFWSMRGMRTKVMTVRIFLSDIQQTYVSAKKKRTV